MSKGHTVRKCTECGRVQKRVAGKCGAQNCNGRMNVIRDSTYQCKLCEEWFEGIGHMLSHGGDACDKCNINEVIPARMAGVHL